LQSISCALSTDVVCCLRFIYLDVCTL